MVRNIVKSLDLTADALVENKSVPTDAIRFMAKPLIKDLRWIPRSLLGGGKRRFAVGESACCLCGLYELCQE